MAPTCGTALPRHGNENHFLATFHGSPYGLSVSFIRTYTLVEVPLSWSNAQRFCRTEYTDLATAENKEEMQELVDAGRRWYGGHLWIGLYDDIHSWRWSVDEEDRSPVSFTNWRNGKPGGLPCVLTHKGQWEDRRCDIKLFFVCQTGEC
uniref:C-type lectin domain-containing protein n=1 Tax=Sphaeramia orbicularis TaxID=375764 RepID=A0A672ZYE8_9TELE